MARTAVAELHNWVTEDAAEVDAATEAALSAAAAADKFAAGKRRHAARLRNYAVADVTVSDDDRTSHIRRFRGRQPPWPQPCPSTRHRCGSS